MLACHVRVWLGLSGATLSIVKDEVVSDTGSVQ